jgi:hypothetical protein
MKHLKHTLETLLQHAQHPDLLLQIDIKHFATYPEINDCNMRFQQNISLLLGRMEARRHVEFTGVELATPAVKAVADLVEKAAAGLHTMHVECELCVG